MDDLVEWLRAQIDEDERVALAVHERERGWRHDVIPDSTGPDHVLLIGDRVVSVGFFEDDPLRPAEAEHTARHDPARILREVEAKRKILDEHQSGEVRSYYDEAEKRYVMETVCLMCVYTYDDEDAGGNRRQYREHAEWPCLTVQYLAEVYAGRPGYREEWRP